MIEVTGTTPNLRLGEEVLVLVGDRTCRLAVTRLAVGGSEPREWTATDCGSPHDTGWIE